MKEDCNGEEVAKLRHVDVLVSQGQNVAGHPPDWRERGDLLSLVPGVGGLKSDRVKRLKDP
jgi:hypothetical protein